MLEKRVFRSRANRRLVKFGKPSISMGHLYHSYVK